MVIQILPLRGNWPSSIYSYLNDIVFYIQIRIKASIPELGNEIKKQTYSKNNKSKLNVELKAKKKPPLKRQLS